MLKVFLVFFMVLISQIIFIVSFTIIEPFSGLDPRIMIPMGILLIYLILYFKYIDNLCKKMKMDKKEFNILYFIFWVITSFALSFIAPNDNPISRLLPSSEGFFAGLEYILVPIILLGYIVIWFLILIIKGIKRKPEK